MDNYTFQLKRPLIIPSPNVSGALFMFRPSLFALSYTMLPNPKEAYMVVTLNIVHAEKGELALPLASYTITETGFPTGVILNQADIDSWDEADANIRASLKTAEAALIEKQGEEYDLLAQGKDVPKELSEAIAALQVEMAALGQELLELGERPEPVELFINKYSDVLQYFDNKGAITSEGIAWARTIPFLGRTIGDYIV